VKLVSLNIILMFFSASSSFAYTQYQEICGEKAKQLTAELGKESSLINHGREFFEKTYFQTRTPRTEIREMIQQYNEVLGASDSSSSAWSRIRFHSMQKSIFSGRDADKRSVILSLMSGHKAGEIDEFLVSVFGYGLAVYSHDNCYRFVSGKATKPMKPRDFENKPKNFKYIQRLFAKNFRHHNHVVEPEPAEIDVPMYHEETNQTNVEVATATAAEKSSARRSPGEIKAD